VVTITEVHREMTRTSYVLLIAIVVFASPRAFCAEPPNIVLLNGKVFTSVVANPYAHAIAIRGDRIVAVGETSAIEALAGPATRRIDLGGRTVIPGFNDAHQHIAVEPATDVDLAVGPPSSWGTVRAAIVKALKTIRLKQSIVAYIGPAVFHDANARRSTLDIVAPIAPVILFTVSGHGAILNSAALHALHIAEDVPDPAGGWFEHSADGRLNGVAHEYAMWPIWRARTLMAGHEESLRQIRRLLLANARLGVTSVQDMSNEFLPESIVHLLKEAPTPIRVRVIRMPVTTPAGRDAAEGRDLPKKPAPLITVSGVKWLLDGTPVETLQAGALRPGDTPTWSQKLAFPAAEMQAMLQESLQNNDQLLLHVFGPVAAQSMLDAMQKSGGPNVWSTKRVRFEHGDGLTPAMIEQAKALGVVVVQSPSHLVVGQFLDPDQVGPQPLRSLIASGVPVALSSDGPVNPFVDIMLASTHPDHPAEAITREEAVIAYTRTAAYAEFEERDLGTLEVGKLADLAVLTQDIFTVPTADLPKTESVLTLVGGVISYDNKTLAVVSKQL
jgi:predicted amidohydrolase YtcJ